MKNVISTLFLTLISISICFAQTAYITNVGDGTVSVINANTNAVTGSITVGGAPYGIGVSPDGNKVYVANYNSNTVSVINTSTNLVTANIPVGIGPYGVRVNADGSKVYVTNYTDNTVSVINATNNTVTNTIAVGTTPRGLDLSPDDTKLYVANNSSNNVSVINTTTNTVTATIAGTNQPLDVSVSPNGSKVYVTNANAASVSVINTNTNTISSTIAVGSTPVSIKHSNDGSKLYVTNYSGGSVTTINAATDAVMATTAVSNGPYGIDMHPDGNTVYVVSYTFGEVDLMNTSTNAITVLTGFSSCVSFGKFVSIYQAVDITGTTNICTGASTTLSASGTGTYQWSTGETTSSITVSPNATTTYSLTVTSPYGYVSTLTKTVTVGGNAPTPIISGPSTNVLCPGNSTSLTASGGNSYLWSTGSTNATINVAPTSTTTYSVTVTNASGCTAAGSYGINVPAALSVAIIGPTSICQGSSTVLQVNTIGGNLTYAWNDQSNSAAITVSPAINTTYSVTITNANGCTATDDQLVSVTAPAQSNIYSGICLGQSYTFNGQNLTASGTYTANYQTANGCDSTVVLTLVVYSQIVPIVNQSGNVLSTGLSTASYQWLLNGVAIPGATTYSYTASQSGDYTVQLTENGCTSTSAVFNYVHVGIDNVWAEGTVLYPNPSDGMIYLNNFQANTIEVFSTDGRLLMTANNASSLNIASLTAGTYLVRCYNNDTLATVRVIKY